MKSVFLCPELGTRKLPRVSSMRRTGETLMLQNDCTRYLTCLSVRYHSSLIHTAKSLTHVLDLHHVGGSRRLRPPSRCHSPRIPPNTTHILTGRHPIHPPRLPSSLPQDFSKRHLRLSHPRHPLSRNRPSSHRRSRRSTNQKLITSLHHPCFLFVLPR